MDAGQGPKHIIQNVEDGRHYLEEEALTDPGECVDLDAMVGSLVQISLLEGILVPVHLAVCSVVLILAQLKMESISETLLKMMEPKVDAMVGKAADKFAELEVVAEKILEGLRAATQGVSDSTAKLAETSTNYHDTLLHHPAQTSSPNSPPPLHLPTQLKAREGIKA